MLFVFSFSWLRFWSLRVNSVSFHFNRVYFLLRFLPYSLLSYTCIYIKFFSFLWFFLLAVCSFLPVYVHIIAAHALTMAPGFLPRRTHIVVVLLFICSHFVFYSSVLVWVLACARSAVAPVKMLCNTERMPVCLFAVQTHPIECDPFHSLRLHFF